MKIVINACYGGFGLSLEAMSYLSERGYKESEYDIERNDPRLIECVETLGKKTNGNYASLKVIEIPDGTEWELQEYDGRESVHEKHKSWS